MSVVWLLSTLSIAHLLFLSFQQHCICFIWWHNTVHEWLSCYLTCFLSSLFICVVSLCSSFSLILSLPITGRWSQSAWSCLSRQFCVRYLADDRKLPDAHDKLYQTLWLLWSPHSCYYSSKCIDYGCPWYILRKNGGGFSLTTIGFVSSLLH